MSDFSILYRSLHRDQKVTKKVERDASSSENKKTSNSEAPVNSFRALLAKIFQLP